MMSCMTEPIRVLLVCRYPLYRLGLRAALGGADAFDEVVDAATGAEALAVAPGLEPHVVVVDSNVVGMLLADLLLRLQHACPSARVLVLVSVTDEHVFGEGVPPAAGYLLRECTGEELLAAVCAVHAGEPVAAEDLGPLLLAAYDSMKLTMVSHGEPVREPVQQRELTAREREVLALLALGRRNRDIAQELFIAENTVKNHVRNILDKLVLTSRVEAATYALRHGVTGERPGDARRA